MSLALVLVLCFHGVALLGLIQRCVTEIRRRTKVRVPALATQSLITRGSTRPLSFPGACSNVRLRHGVDRAD